MANLKVSIIEKVRIAKGMWENRPVEIPKPKPNGKGLYLKDQREGKFYLVWREGKRKQYEPVHGRLSDAIQKRERKELYLASVAKGLRVEDPTATSSRLTIAAAINDYLSILTGRGNTVALHTFSLRQFEEWNTKHARNKKTLLDAIDRQHVLAFYKWAMEQGGRSGEPNDELTAAWKCIRVNKMIKTMLNLGPGEGPVKKSDFREVFNRKPAVVTYTKDERDLFLACCVGVVFLLWSLFLKCGLRLKELSHLEWKDIDWATHVIHIRVKLVTDGAKVVEFRPKKHSIRDVAIPDDLFTLLKNLKETSKSHLVFPTRTGASTQSSGTHASELLRERVWTHQNSCRRTFAAPMPRTAYATGTRLQKYEISLDIGRCILSSTTPMP